MSVVITLILAFVFLHESVTPKTVLGCVLIGAGTAFDGGVEIGHTKEGRNLDHDL